MTSTSSYNWERLGTQALPRAEASPTASGAFARSTTFHQRYETVSAGSSDPWTTAYNEAMGQLDDDMRAVVQKGRNLEELRGMERMQTPLKYLETTLDVAKPLASLDPGSSAAVGLIQSVTTVCAKKDTQRPMQQTIAVTPEPLSIAAVYGTEALLKGILGDIDVRRDHGEKPRPNAVCAVLAQGELCRLPVLMRYNDGADISQAMQGFCRVIQAWGDCNRITQGKMAANISEGFEEVFDYMEGSYDAIVEYEWGNELLCRAADSGCLPFIKRLFDAAEHNQPLRRDLLKAPHRGDGGRLFNHQSVGEAVWNCHEDVVRFLLEQDGIEAHLRHKDAVGDTVFHKAVRYERKPVFELLISQFPDGVNQKNNSGDTPLHLVVSSGNAKLANLLLSMGRADVRCGSTEEPSGWHDPIRMAARYDNVAMCEVLVGVGGADPLSVFKTNADGSLDFIDPFEDEKVASRVRAALFSLKMEQEGK